MNNFDISNGIGWIAFLNGDSDSIDTIVARDRFDSCSVDVERVTAAQHNSYVAFTFTNKSEISVWKVGLQQQQRTGHHRTPDYACDWPPIFIVSDANAICVRATPSITSWLNVNEIS